MPAYFTRGSGHDAKGQYSERPDDYVENMDRLARKFETARAARAEAGCRDGRRRENRLHRLRHVALGDYREPRSAARGNRRQDVVLPAARLSVHRGAVAFIDAHERVYVVEQNRDAQLLQLMRLELTPDRIAEAPQRPALQRPADRCPQRHRRCAGAGRVRGREEDGGRVSAGRRAANRDR